MVGSLGLAASGDGAISTSAVQGRRADLADATLAVLGERGYAAATLKEIADRSEFSDGALRYYFHNRSDLISYSVRHYKAECVNRYDVIVDTAVSAEELLQRVVASMAATLVDDAPMHRLWYDLRSSAMFEPGVRDAAQEIDGWLQAMIWRIVTRGAELAGLVPAYEARTTYAIVDGVFEAALVALTFGSEEAAVAGFVASATAVMPGLLRLDK